MKNKLFGVIGAVVGIALGATGCKSVEKQSYKDSTEYVHIHYDLHNCNPDGQLLSYEFLDNGMIKCEVIWAGTYMMEGVGLVGNTSTTTCILPLDRVSLYSHGYCNICGKII